MKVKSVRNGLAAWSVLCFVGGVTVFAWGGCEKKEEGEGKEKKGKGGVPVADENGKYKVYKELPERWKCKRDRDCRFTHLRPGNCCPNQCGVYAGTLKWVRALRKMHYPVCRPFLRKHGFNKCGNPKCPPPKGIPKAKCEEGKCALWYKKIGAYNKSARQVKQEIKEGREGATVGGMGKGKGEALEEGGEKEGSADAKGSGKEEKSPRKEDVK